MKILVTGASGFIGRRLVEALLRRGHEVRGLVGQSNGTELKQAGVEVVRGDLRDAAAMENAVKNCDSIYHLAAKTTKSRLPKRQYYAHNVAGTINVARAALTAGVRRFVFASSIGVYGTTSNLNIDEDTATSPDSYYRETKLRGEEELLRLHRESGLPLVIARVGTCYGPGSTSFLELCRKISTNSFRMIGNGENYQEIVYVDDLVDALRRCGDTSGVEGRSYILKGLHPIKLKEMLEILSRHIKGTVSLDPLPIAPFRSYQQFARFIYRALGQEIPRGDYYGLFVTDHIFTTTRAYNELGYRPKVSVNEGMARLVEWHRGQGQLAG